MRLGRVGPADHAFFSMFANLVGKNPVLETVMAILEYVFEVDINLLALCILFGKHGICLYNISLSDSLIQPITTLRLCFEQEW